MKKIIFFGLCLLWMIIVFLFSNQVGEKSSSTSGQVVSILIKIFPSLSKDINFLNLVIRKFAHFTLYAVGGILYFNLFKSYKIKNMKSLLCSEVICIMYAISDEIHQFFVPGRTCSIKDVIIDSIGAFTGCLLFVLLMQVIIILTKNSFKCKNI